MKLQEKLALCAPKRTPFAQIAKALGRYPSHHLGKIVAEEILKTTQLNPEKLDGVVVGEGFPGAPNAARVIQNLLDFPVEQVAVTVNQNCVSSLEAVAEAARRIQIGEGETYLVLGEESQTAMPFIISGARMNKKANSLAKLKKLLPDNLPEGVELRDLLEEGLGDGETSFGMQVTAEILAQNYQISRELSDKFAYESFKRALEATQAGYYRPYLVPVQDDKGELLEDDEAVLLRKGIVENPERMKKAMLLFDNPYFKWDEFPKKYGEFLTEGAKTPTVTIFNACPRSDGASGLIVTTEAKAKELGLEIKAWLLGYASKGVHPNYMGIGQAMASLKLLEDLGKSITEVDQIEIHEAFSATAIGALEEIKKQTGFDWEAKFDQHKINKFGGSIAIGHPFGATGIRLITNAMMDFEHDPEINNVLLTACAHGGVAGALFVERA